MKFCFNYRIVDWWNALPQEAIDAPSVNAFKGRLDKHFQNHEVYYNYRALGHPLDII